MEIFLAKYYCQSAGTELPAVLATLKSIESKLDKIMTDLNTLATSVANATSVEQSAITLLQGLKAQLDAAGTDPVALKSLSDQLDASTQTLADAVAANTPAGPGA